MLMKMPCWLYRDRPIDQEGQTYALVGNLLSCHAFVGDQLCALFVLPHTLANLPRRLTLRTAVTECALVSLQMKLMTIVAGESTMPGGSSSNSLV